MLWVDKIKGSIVSYGQQTSVIDAGAITGNSSNDIGEGRVAQRWCTMGTDRFHVLGIKRGC